MIFLKIFKGLKTMYKSLKILDDLEQIGGPVWVQFESSLIQTGLRLSGFFFYRFLIFF